MNLECPTDPAWLCIVGQYKYSSQVLFLIKDKYLAVETEEGKFTFHFCLKSEITIFYTITWFSGLASKNKKTKNNLLPPSTAVDPGANGTPGRITFLEELNDRFITIFPELWKIGQAYFNRELFVRVDLTKQDEFKVATIVFFSQ